MEKMTLWWCVADVWGPVAAAARGAGRHAGVGDALGRKLGWPRELVRPAAARAWASRGGEVKGWSVAGAGLAISFFSTFLSLFYFYFSILIIPWVFMSVYMYCQA